MSGMTRALAVMSVTLASARLVCSSLLNSPLLTALAMIL